MTGNVSEETTKLGKMCSSWLHVLLCGREVFRNTLVSLCVVRGAGIAVVRFGQLRVNYNTGLGTGMSCQLMRCSPSSHSIFWALNLSSVQVIEGILVLMKN